MQTENVHLLVVEDNRGYLDELQSWLKDTFGYKEIQTASSVKEAKEKLNVTFDVIISDMRMEEDDSGFTIVNEVKERNISSVIIILTANDSVKDCHTAFKSGVWDYIPKTKPGNVFDALHLSIQDAIAYFNRWGNAHDKQWISENLETLKQTYYGQYIAVINKTVIDVADTEEDLNKQIDERQLRRFLTTIKKIGDLRPISELIKLPESEQLEYKSTLQWDVIKNRRNEDLKWNVVKTIAAFLNSEGGTLIIGVEDNGNIFGLEKDLSLFSKGKDEFKQTIMNYVCDYIGPSFASLIKTRFETIEGKDVCAIYVQKSSKPVFVKNKEALIFYIRADNTSRPLGIPAIYNRL
ncbi:MAG: RNA-binding domain-containing protein [Gloeotrichia echinulata CP02]|jgi:ActR/RegA family two-component response regulator